MKSRPSDLVIAAVAQQLNDSIDEAEASQTKLLERIAALQLQVAEKQQDIAHKRQLREYLHNGLGDLLRPVVDGRAAVTDRRISAPASMDVAEREQEYNSDRVYRLIVSKPDQVWVARQVHDQLPDIKITAIRSILQRLYQRGKLARPEKGQYLHSTSYRDPSTDSDRTASHQTPTGQSATGESQVGADSRGDRLAHDSRGAGLDERIVGVLSTDPGHSRQLATLAEALNSPPTVVHAALQGLLRSGGVVTAIDGGYLVPPDEKSAAAN